MHKIGINYFLFCNSEEDAFGREGLAVGKERIVSLDFLKAIAILSVVMGHIASPFSSFIFSWHMPAFFVASGFLLGMRDAQHATTSVFSKKDLFHLGGYYLFFGVLGITAEFFKDVALGRPILPLGESLLGLLYFMDMPHLHHYGFVLWFLPALFWGKIFTRGLFLYVGKSLLMLVASFLLFWVEASDGDSSWVRRARGVAVCSLVCNRGDSLSLD